VVFSCSVRPDAAAEEIKVLQEVDGVDVDDMLDRGGDGEIGEGRFEPGKTGLMIRCVKLEVVAVVVANTRDGRWGRSEDGDAVAGRLMLAQLVGKSVGPFLDRRLRRAAENNPRQLAEGRVVEIAS
jgi:hypothetical protein